MQTLRVEIWSDIACPWCYIGKRHFEAALSRFAHRDAVQVVWRAFELDPSAPPVLDMQTSYAERLAKKYGTSVAEGEAMLERMTSVAAKDGLEFRFDKIRPGNTFDAHRLLHLAGERGLQDALKERFLLAYMTQGEAIGDRSTLSRLASEVGLAQDEVEAVLSTDAHAREVRDDQKEAAALGIRGVPFFAFGRQFGVSGAQPADVLLSALERAWAELETDSEPLAEGSACGPEGCS